MSLWYFDVQYLKDLLCSKSKEFILFYFIGFSFDLMHLNLSTTYNLFSCASVRYRSWTAFSPWICNSHSIISCKGHLLSHQIFLSLFLKINCLKRCQSITEVAFVFHWSVCLSHFVLVRDPFGYCPYTKS